MSRLIFVLLIASCWIGSVATARTWTNVKGQELEAELVEIQDESIVIRSGRDGKIYTYKIEWLSRADQQYLQALQDDANAPETAAPPPAPEPVVAEPVVESEQTAVSNLTVGNWAKMLLYVAGGGGVLLVLFLLRKVLFNNVLTGFAFGAVTALICAVVWAVITVVTGFQIGWMAIGVGVAVGLMVRVGGDHGSFAQGMVGGFLALCSCILGNVFAAIGFLGEEAGVTFFQSIRHNDFSLVLEYYKAMFAPIDLLFYGLAIIEGFKLATFGEGEG